MKSRWIGRWPIFLLAIVVGVACAQTDAGMTTKIKSKFAADDMVKAYQIDVDTKEKVVTLTGTVDSQAAKDQALTLARGTEGVADVVDNITVSGAEGETMMEPGTMEPGMMETPGMMMTPGMMETPSMMTTPEAEMAPTPPAR